MSDLVAQGVKNFAHMFDFREFDEDFARALVEDAQEPVHAAYQELLEAAEEALVWSDAPSLDRLRRAVENLSVITPDTTATGSGTEEP